MKNKKKEAAKSCSKTSIGGQAVIEGVMMKGPYKTVLAVRNEKTGNITVETMAENKKKNPIMKIPFIRGFFVFLSSLITGTKTIMRSATLAGEDDGEEEPTKFEKWYAKKTGRSAMDIVLTVSLILGLALSIFLFIFAPTRVTALINTLTGGAMGKPLISVIEGVLKLLILIGYLLIVSSTKSMKRVFQYHGAEHKTIFCYEAGLPLTVENVKIQKRFHPRCGTSFLVIVMLISMAIFMIPIFPVENWFLRFLCKLAFLPVVSGISYELIKIAGRYDNFVTKIISAPGKALQRITTKEPDESQIEVAIASMEPVIPENKEDAAW